MKNDKEKQVKEKEKEKKEAEDKNEFVSAFRGGIVGPQKRRKIDYDDVRENEYY